MDYSFAFKPNLLLLSSLSIDSKSKRTDHKSYNTYQVFLIIGLGYFIMMIYIFFPFIIITTGYLPLNPISSPLYTIESLFR